jgi:epoxide hydrolase
VAGRCGLGSRFVGESALTSRVKAARRAIGDDGRTDQNDPVDTLILDRMDAFQNDGSGYLAIQNTRPQTIGYGLVDSPLVQLAWIAEKVHEWTDLPVDRDKLLTSVSLYWFTGSGVTAAHTLYEQAHSSDWGAPAAVPQGFAVFGAYETVRKLVPAPAEAHWTEFPPRQALPGDGGPHPAGGGPAGVLRATAMTQVLGQHDQLSTLDSPSCCRAATNGRGARRR